MITSAAPISCSSLSSSSHQFFKFNQNSDQFYYNFPKTTPMSSTSSMPSYASNCRNNICSVSSQSSPYSPVDDEDGFLSLLQIGEVETVSLGDEEARNRKSKKSILERKSPPAFPFLIEIREAQLGYTYGEKKG